MPIALWRNPIVLNWLIMFCCTLRIGSRIVCTSRGNNYCLRKYASIPNNQLLTTYAQRSCPYANSFEDIRLVKWRLFGQVDFVRVFIFYFRRETERKRKSGGACEAANWNSADRIVISYTWMLICVVCVKAKVKMILLSVCSWDWLPDLFSKWFFVNYLWARRNKALSLPIYEVIHVVSLENSFIILCVTP